MQYRSTRGHGPVGFGEVLTGGVAPDGGLYLPEARPELDVDADWIDLPYPEVVARVLLPFVEPYFGLTDLRAMAGAAYADFRDPAIAPIEHLWGDVHLLDLTKGPTLSFKDFALSLVGRMLDAALERSGGSITVLGATSGDTGSAAIAALAGLERVRVVMLHPAGRVSDVQRRQMTTVLADNVTNLAVAGSFDDCQDLVKGAFAHDDLVETHDLVAVNSINWVRIAAQTAYHTWAAVRLGATGRPIVVSVPSGNFGNAYAAHVAAGFGAPIAQIVVATNANNRLARFLETGSLEIGEVAATHAPAMDIQVPSNLERLIFEALDRDPAATADLMARYRRTGRLRVPSGALAPFRARFSSGWMGDDAVLAAIAETHERTGRLVDPHTAIGLAIGRMRAAHPGAPLVAVATADPAKFPDAVEAATGIRPSLPDDLADLFDRPERFEVIESDPALLADRL